MKTKNENHNGLEQTLKTTSPQGKDGMPLPINFQPGNQCVNPKSKIVNSSIRRSTGKVSRLPRHVRLEVSYMIEDGLTYNEIIAKLNELGYPGFFYQNIQRWRHGVGHQAFLRQQERCYVAVMANLIQNPIARAPVQIENPPSPQSGTSCVNRKSTIENSPLALSSGN
jgi:hypothetical protein